MKYKNHILITAMLCTFGLVIYQSRVQVQTVLSPQQKSADQFAPKPLIPLGSDPLSLLQSPDAEQRKTEAYNLIANKEALEDGLQANVETLLKQSARRRTEHPNDAANQLGTPEERAAVTSIGLMGEFRSTRCIPFLVDHISSVFVVALHPVGLGGVYPCAGSLASIGSPSLDPLLVKVEDTDDPKTMRLATYVFVKVLGNNVGAAFVADRRRKITDPSAKHRLDRFEQIVRTTQFSD